MKKHRSKNLSLRKLKVASLKNVYQITGGTDDPKTNTNTISESFMCPPETDPEPGNETKNC